jgi:hypothetical protein
MRSLSRDGDHSTRRIPATIAFRLLCNLAREPNANLRPELPLRYPGTKNNGSHFCKPLFIWRARQDLNPRPPGS